MTRLKLAAPLALAMTAAFAVPALAETNEVSTPYYNAPHTTYYVSRDYVYVPVERDYYYVPQGAPVYSYTPDTTAYYVEPAPVYYAGPVVVYGTPGNTDAAITADVQDAIVSDPYINGHIDVDTRRGDVTLQGRVTTPGQIDRAGNAARSARWRDPCRQPGAVASGKLLSPIRRGRRCRHRGSRRPGSGPARAAAC